MDKRVPITLIQQLVRKKVERLKTGSESIDTLLNGGIEKGIITNIYGESGTGKTNLCIQLAVRTAEKGEKAIYVDTEGGFSPERFLQMTDEENLEHLYLQEPMDFEEQKEAIRQATDLATNNQVGLIIVDSMVSLYRLKVNSDNASEINQKLSQQLSELSKVARKQNIPVVVTNQVYTSFDEDKLELVGRDVPRYWSKCLLKLKNNGKRSIVVSKHRSLPENRSKTFKITDKGLK